ncbi:MAG TPA: hypothetical protein VFC02_18650 [Anaerolineales bacterium]|nr:hypothetical protein [Anaerolineales bacterium]
MSLSDDIKSTLEADDELMDLLTGGIFNDVEEINRQDTPAAFDSQRELKPCALIKVGTESKRGPYERSVQTPITIYFYQRAGYTVIEPAMEMTYDLLNDQRIGTRVWQLIYEISVNQQRDLALDCPLGSHRFVAVRHR